MSVGGSGPWADQQDIEGLASYGVRQIVMRLTLSWDGGTEARLAIIGKFFNQEEGKVLSIIGASAFQGLLEKVRAEAEEHFAKLVSEDPEYDANMDGALVIDVPTGTFQFELAYD